ncbi:hypothetical protein KEM52_002076 [Ascosphaera acerosa]|nr:hypothetical protein KEM52_002076 [Ascosphaera acerosa]
MTHAESRPQDSSYPDLHNASAGPLSTSEPTRYGVSSSRAHKKTQSLAWSLDSRLMDYTTCSVTGSQGTADSPTAGDLKAGSSIASQSPAAGSARRTAAAIKGNTDGLAPFSLLRKSTTAGNFTIANILNAEEDSSSSSGTERGRSGSMRDTAELHIDEKHDPIVLGLVSLPTAQGLFESFFQYMNTFICQFDPRLHTMRYIRTRSAFLFSALLCATAKFLAPDLHQRLYDHVESQLREIMPAGQKSTEIVQGILLMTYWKQPSDSRAWLLVGYAIRACIEMGWHQLPPTNLEPGMTMLQPDREMELRERRNKERTWLLLFVYDRSVSLQVGKPWMIQMDAVIRASETWHQHAYAVPGVDQIMSAFVQLRILGSDLLDICQIDPRAGASEAFHRNESVLSSFNDHLDRWETHWYKTVEDATANISHRFIIHFYGAHLRLLVNSYRLQLSIVGGVGIAKQALWVCYLSALSMLRLVIDRLGVGSHLFYCQDSIHVMIAYATVMLIKILLSLPGELPADSESQILDVIREASEAFSRQKPAGDTSCFYQQRFLANVVDHYLQTQQESTAAGSQWARRMTATSTGSNGAPSSAALEGLGGTIAAASSLLNLDRRASAPTGLYANMPPPPHRWSVYRQSQQISPISETGVPNTYSEISPPPTAGSLPGNPQEPTYLPSNQKPFAPPHARLSMSCGLPQPVPSLSMAGSAPYQQVPGSGSVFAPPTPLEQAYPAFGGGSFSAPSGSYQLFTDNIVWEDLFAGAGFSVNNGAFLPVSMADA